MVFPLPLPRSLRAATAALTRAASRRVLIPLAAALLCAVDGGGALAGTAPIVATASGPVLGVARHGTVEFRGIPYAEAPVGPLRWASPKPARHWKGVRDGTAFGPACPQQARFNLTEGSEDEDCLSLNVTVPTDRKPGERLPVMFWIHGGGFVGGGTNLYRLDKLAREGRMIVVSANYRVGVLGFLAHPAFEDARHHNGNYGLEDQRLALRWVQRNIGVFGGDPRKVTVAGESAGAGSICMHLASPERVDGLFRQAILQSAGCLQPMKTVEQAEPVGTAIAAAVGCGNGDRSEALACLRRKPVGELLDAQGRYAATHLTDFIPFAPVAGTPDRPSFGLPRSVRAAVDQGRLVRVPMLMGGTRHEVRLYVGYWWQGGRAGHNPPVDEANLPGWLEAFYGREAAAAIMERYRPAAGWPNAGAVAETLGALMSDYTPGVGINNCMYLHTSQAIRQAPVRRGAKTPAIYQFEFADEDAPVLGVGIGREYPDFRMGSVHSSELNYLFPNLSNTSRIDAPDLAPASARLADRMVAAWAAFIRDGRPKAPGLPAWPAFTGGDTVMLLKPEVSVPYDADAHHQCSAFWQKQFKLP